MKSMKILALLTTTATLVACGSSSDQEHSHSNVANPTL